VPAGWEGKKQEGAFLMSPKDLGEGKLYTVFIPDLTRKIGTLKGILEVGKATLGEAGTFKPAREPAASRNEAGWDYEVLIGTLEKGDKGMLAQAIALRKGEQEGLVLLLSDSVATMEKYSDAFSAMIKGIGAPAPAAAAGKVDLLYTTPPGWKTQAIEGGVILDRAEEGADDRRFYRLLILPSQPLEGRLRTRFLEQWPALVKANIETKIVPVPLVRRLKSGMAVAFDQDSAAKNKDGVAHHATLYLLARGTRYVPILGFYYNLGNTDNLTKALVLLMESAEIPGAGQEKVALIDPADLVGDWSNSSYSMANYVTSSGGYAGDASIAVLGGVNLNKDQTYTKTLIALTRDRRVKEVDQGDWKLEDNELLLTVDKEAREKPKVFRIFGVGGDPKAATFLILSDYNNTDQQADLAYPRRSFSGEWYKRK